MQRQICRALAALGVLAGVVLAPGLGSAAARATPAQARTAALARSATQARAARLPGTAPPARTVVTFTWGGGLADQMGALPVFRRYRMPATFYVPSGLVCPAGPGPGCQRSPYLTLADVRQIAADGNEIGGLSVQHVPLTGMPAGEAQREICDDRVNLTRWGFRVTDFAYPFAQVNHTLQDLAQRCGYNSGLGTGQLRGAGLCPHCAWAEAIPPRDPYLLRAPIEVSSVGTTWSPATFEKIITGAQQHGGGWIIFTVHDVCARACALGVTRPELSSVLGWLARQAGHGVSVRTVRQVIGGPVRPAVAGPGPPRIPPPGVANSRLSAVTAGGIPACFQTGRYGTNHATFRYRRRAGPGGAGAELISLTQRRSGTAQLVPAMDLGTCAPGVTAGRSYTMGAWYKSSGPVVFNAYYRTSAGTWKFWVTSPPMPASRGWTPRTWTAPAVPSGATAISFGVALRSDGTLATTRYSLAPARYTSTRLAVFGVLVAVVLVAAVATRRLRRRPGPGQPVSRGPGRPVSRG
jgi:peptidoglycan/xylan/chitin deacetylase (PgdA/CDA1 family)